MILFSMWSTVAIQLKDGGLWTHGTVEGRGDPSHNNRSYMIHITKTGQIVIKKKKHIKATPITVEQFLQDQIRQKTL